MTLTKECKNCYYWKTEFDNKYALKGICRFSAPAALKIKEGHHYAEAYWPTVNCDDYCGSYEEKERCDCGM